VSRLIEHRKEKDEIKRALFKCTICLLSNLLPSIKIISIDQENNDKIVDAKLTILYGQIKKVFGLLRTYALQF